MDKHTKKILTEALEEDIPFGDIATDTIINSVPIKAYIISNSNGIFCGEIVLKTIVDMFRDMKIQELNVTDGGIIKAKSVVATLNGPANLIIGIERTLLNFVSFLSGVATTTNVFVKKLAGTGIVLKDTRKTLPNLRILQKYAVEVGGGKNHRMNLTEFPIVKDNHIKLLMNNGEKYFIKRIQKLEKVSRGNFEVEIQDLKVLDLIRKYNIYIKYIMFDNMSLCDLKEGIELVRKYEKKMGKKVFVELSGGINLENIDEYKHFDVDYISVGSITKNVCAVDFSLEIQP